MPVWLPSRRDLGVGLVRVGRHREVLTIDQEAEPLFGVLAADNPAVYQGEHANTRTALRAILRQLDREGEMISLGLLGEDAKRDQSAEEAAEIDGNNAP
jgi:hypothetical protein